MMTVFSLERRVEFFETDAAGIAHFSSLAVYMEQAEHSLFRSLGLSVFPQMSVDPQVVSPHGADSEFDVTWPRVHLSIDFLGPARFEEILKIDVMVARLGNSSVTFEHRIHCHDRPVASGKSISVCCRIDRSGTHGLVKQLIPRAIHEKLSQYLKDS